MKVGRQVELNVGRTIILWLYCPKSHNHNHQQQNHRQAPERRKHGHARTIKIDVVEAKETLTGVEFNVELEQRCGVLPTDWDSSLTVVRRHAITILTRHGAYGSPFWWLQRYNLNGDMEVIAPTTDFTCTRCQQVKVLSSAEF